MAVLRPQGVLILAFVKGLRAEDCQVGRWVWVWVGVRCQGGPIFENKNKNPMLGEQGVNSFPVLSYPNGGRP